MEGELPGVSWSAMASPFRPVEGARAPGWHPAAAGGRRRRRARGRRGSDARRPAGRRLRVPLRPVARVSLVGLVAPVDATGVGPVDDRGRAVGAEVVPAPGHERIRPAADPAHQVRVHAQPGGERDRPVQLVPVLADLGHGGTAADHRHDPLVVVVERLAGVPADVGDHVAGRPLPALQGDRAQLRVRVPSGAGTLATSPTAYTPGTSSTVRSCSTTQPPAPADRQPGPLGQRRRHHAAGPDHACGWRARCRR